MMPLDSALVDLMVQTLTTYYGSVEVKGKPGASTKKYTNPWKVGEGLVASYIFVTPKHVRFGNAVSKSLIMTPAMIRRIAHKEMDKPVIPAKPAEEA